MAAKGQTEKNSVRANVFRVTPESGHCSIQSACLKGAMKRLMHRSKLGVSRASDIGETRRHRTCAARQRRTILSACATIRPRR